MLSLVETISWKHYKERTRSQVIDMALVFLEGFELPATEFEADLTDHFSEQPLVSSGIGLSSYNGFQGRLLGSAEDLSYFTCTRSCTSSLEATWTYFVSVYVEAAASDGTVWFALSEGSQPIHTFAVTKSGTSVFGSWYAGVVNSIPIQVGSNLGSTGTWITVEVQVTLPASGVATGTLKARINGEGSESIDLSNVVTTSGSSGVGADSVMYHTNSVAHFDDLWADTSAVWRGNTLGVQGHVVDSVVSSNSSVSGGADQVAVLTDNNDGSYAIMGTSGDKDLFTLTDGSELANSVIGIKIVARVACTEVGTRDINLITKLSATEDPSSTANSVVSRNPSGVSEIRTTKPGGGAFSVSDLAALEVGYELNN